MKAKSLLKRFTAKPTNSRILRSFALTAKIFYTEATTTEEDLALKIWERKTLYLPESKLDDSFVQLITPIVTEQQIIDAWNLSNNKSSEFFQQVADEQKHILKNLCKNPLPPKTLQPSQVLNPDNLAFHFDSRRYPPNKGSRLRAVLLEANMVADAKIFPTVVIQDLPGKGKTSMFHNMCLNNLLFGIFMDIEDDDVRSLLGRASEITGDTKLRQAFRKLLLSKYYTLYVITKHIHAANPADFLIFVKYGGRSVMSNIYKGLNAANTKKIDLASALAALHDAIQKSSQKRIAVFFDESITWQVGKGALIRQDGKLVPKGSLLNVAYQETRKFTIPVLASTTWTPVESMPSERNALYALIGLLPGLAFEQTSSLINHILETNGMPKVASLVQMVAWYLVGNMRNVEYFYRYLFQTMQRASLLSTSESYSEQQMLLFLKDALEVYRENKTTMAKKFISRYSACIDLAADLLLNDFIWSRDSMAISALIDSGIANLIPYGNNDGKGVKQRFQIHDPSYEHALFFLMFHLRCELLWKKIHNIQSPHDRLEMFVMMLMVHEGYRLGRKKGITDSPLFEDLKGSIYDNYYLASRVIYREVNLTEELRASQVNAPFAWMMQLHSDQLDEMLVKLHDFCRIDGMGWLKQIEPTIDGFCRTDELGWPKKVNDTTLPSRIPLLISMTLQHKANVDPTDLEKTVEAMKDTLTPSTFATVSTSIQSYLKTAEYSRALRMSFSPNMKLQRCSDESSLLEQVKSAADEVTGKDYNIDMTQQRFIMIHSGNNSKVDEVIEKYQGKAFYHSMKQVYDSLKSESFKPETFAVIVHDGTTAKKVRVKGSTYGAIVSAISTSFKIPASWFGVQVKTGNEILDDNTAEKVLTTRQELEITRVTQQVPFEKM